MSETIQKPNAFAFKAFIDSEYRLCICPRVDDQWSEKDIYYIPENQTELGTFLEERLFNVVFVNIRKEENGFWLDYKNSYYLKSDGATSEELYLKGEFFKTVEKGYQAFYEQPTSEREGQQTSTGEQKSV